MNHPTPDIFTPERTSDHQETDISRGYERLDLREWYPQPDEPGFIVIERAIGRRRTTPSSNAAAYETFLTTNELGYMGMRPALQALGIYTSAVRSRKRAYDEKLTIQYPSVDKFCQTANNFLYSGTPASSKDEGGIRFEAWDDTAFSGADAVRAMARGAMLIPAKGPTYIGILDHALAGLAINSEVINSLQAQAGSLLRETKLKNQSIAESPRVDAMGQDLYTMLHLGNLQAFLNEEPGSSAPWQKFFTLSEEVTAAHMRGKIQMNIERLSDLALNQGDSHTRDRGIYLM